MNLADLGYSILTGEWKLQRAQARERATFMEATRDLRDKMIKAGVMRANSQHMQFYAGAEPGIARPYPNTLSTPEDYKQAYERIVLIRGARQMEEDLAFPDGMLDDFETYVIGDCLVYQPNTGNPDADRVIRDYLEWQFDQIDYSQRLDLTKMAQVGIRSMKRDGDCGFEPIDVGDAIRIRYTSGDSIGNPLIGANIGPSNYNGILTDPVTDAPAVYQIWRRVQKMNAYYFDRNVPADQFWHYYDPFRFQQYHGVTVFKNAIADYFDIQQIMEFSKLNIKFRSSQLPTVHTETGRPRGAGYGWFGYGSQSGPGGPNPNGQPVSAAGVPLPMSVNVDGVTQNFLKLDEAVMDYPHDFPNQQLIVMIQELNRRCAKGAKLPIEFVYQAANGGVVQRFWANKAEQTFNKDKHLVRRTLLNPTKNRVIQKGIDTGELDLRAFGDLDVSVERFRGRWQMGRAISVDYGRETDADIKKIDAGLMSAADKVADDGGNLDDVLKETDTHVRRVIDMAKQTAEKFDIDFAIVLPYYLKKFPNPGAGLKAASAATTQQAVDAAEATSQD